MLLEFSVANFLSFKEKVTLSMLASKKEDLYSENVIKNAQGSEYDLLKSVAIYGANASGKSNLVKAVYCMGQFVLSSVYMSSFLQENITPFRLQTSPYDMPSEFDVSFLHDGIRYKYGFKVTVNKVVEEWFYSFPKKQPRKLFERNAASKQPFIFGSHWEGDKSDIAKKTRENSLFVTVAANYNNKFAKIVFDFFHELVDIFGSKKSPPIKMIADSLFMDKKISSDEIYEFSIKKADMGISKIIVEEKSIVETKKWSGLSEGMRKDIINRMGKGFGVPKYIEISSVHRYKDESGIEKDVNFDFDEESDGTQKLYFLSAPILKALRNGGVVFIDEFESRLHPVLCKALINIFNCEKQNKSNAQFIFTTHNSGLLGEKLFRRDQIWFTEKNQSGATELYSLDDINGIRKDENYEKGYLHGRYGAIPIIGDFCV